MRTGVTGPVGALCVMGRCVRDTAASNLKTDPDMFLSDNDREILLKTLNAKDPALIQARMANALLLLAEGLSAEDVAGLLYVDEASVVGWQTIFSKRNQKAA